MHRLASRADFECGPEIMGTKSAAIFTDLGSSHTQSSDAHDPGCLKVKLINRLHRHSPAWNSVLPTGDTEAVASNRWINHHVPVLTSLFLGFTNDVQ